MKNLFVSRSRPKSLFIHRYRSIFSFLRMTSSLIKKYTLADNSTVSVWRGECSVRVGNPQPQVGAYPII
jgi:hypothetical protein